jgi:ParB/RepB/Spo0J family partition protein
VTIIPREMDSPVLADASSILAGATIAHIPIDLIDIGDNVRTEIGDLEDLAKSIEQFGVMQPVRVRSAGDRYALVFGQRRVLAASLAGHSSVPAIVESTETAPLDRSLEQLVENLQRRDLNPMEEARALARILKDDPSLTQEELGNRIGRSQPYVANTLKLLALAPAVQEMVMAGALSASHAKAIAGLSPDDQVEFAQRAIAEGLSAHALELEAKRFRAELAQAAKLAAQSDRAAGSRLEAALRVLERDEVESDDLVLVGSAHAELVEGLQAAGYQVEPAGSRSVRRDPDADCCSAWLLEEKWGNPALVRACVDPSHEAALAGAMAPPTSRVSAAVVALLADTIRAEIATCPSGLLLARLLVWTFGDPEFDEPDHLTALSAADLAARISGWLGRSADVLPLEALAGVDTAPVA